MTIEQINQISIKEFGFDILTLSSIAALWVAEYIFRTYRKNVYSKIDEHRHRYGKPMCFPTMYTPLWYKEMGIEIPDF